MGPRLRGGDKNKEPSMQPTPLTERHYYDGSHATPSWLAELYCLWRLCPRTACRRAQACRGGGCACQTGLALVPSDALDFVATFEQARDDGLSYDEMIDVCSDELAALERWRGQVERSVAP
jgi:hypothetical protein